MIALPSDTPSPRWLAWCALCVVAGVGLVTVAGYALGGPDAIRQRWYDREEARGNLVRIDAIYDDGQHVSGRAWKKDLPKFERQRARWREFYERERQGASPSAGRPAPPRQAPAAPRDSLTGQPAQPSTAPVRRHPAVPLR